MGYTVSQPSHSEVNYDEDDAALKETVRARHGLAGRMKGMRRLMMAGLPVLFGLCGSAEAQTSPPSAAALATIQAIVAAHPHPDEGLRDAIAAAVEADPALAAAGVQVAWTATPEQQMEIGLGLGEAGAKLQATGIPADIAAAQRILQIADGGPPLLIAAFTLAGGITGLPAIIGTGIGPSVRTSKDVVTSVLAVTGTPVGTGSNPVGPGGNPPIIVGVSPKCISPAVPGVNCNP